VFVRERKVKRETNEERQSLGEREGEERLRDERERDERERDRERQYDRVLFETDFFASSVSRNQVYGVRSFLKKNTSGLGGAEEIEEIFG
jgi:hypothetical protein